MVYRKMRTRMKRGTVRRPRRKYRRRTTRRMQNKAEVKYFTYQASDLATNVAHSVLGSTDLFGNQHQLSAMLSGII